MMIYRKICKYTKKKELIKVNDTNSQKQLSLDNFFYFSFWRKSNLLLELTAD